MIPPTARKPSRRLQAIAVAVGPVLIVLALTTLEVARSRTSFQTSCWLLPNLRILPVPGVTRCPLESGEVIRSVAVDGRLHAISDLTGLDELLGPAGSTVRVGASRAGRIRWVELEVDPLERRDRLARVAEAAAAALLLVALPGFLLWRSGSRAAPALAAFYAAFAILVVGLLTGRSASVPTLAAVLALIAMPSTLFHLALRFPRDRPLAVEFPIVCRIPYLLAPFLAGLAWIALYREPLIWSAFLLLLVCLIGTGWMLVSGACWFAMRESELPLERARSRVVFYGSALLPLLPTLAIGIPERSDAEALGVIFLWSAAATMPLPIGLAISRYNLFDLGLDIRHGVAWILYLAASSLSLATLLYFVPHALGAEGFERGFATLTALSLVCVVALEPLRRHVPGLLESTFTPRLRTLARLRQKLELDLSTVADADFVAVRLARAAKEGLRATHGSIFLCEDGAPVLAHVFGRSPPHRTSLALDALSLLDTAPLAHLAAAPGLDASAASLRTARVEVVARLTLGPELLGVLLLGGSPSGTPYGGVELDFVSSLCSQAALAIRRARFQVESLAHERAAAAGRLALALAHDTGKDVGWLRKLARRLPDRSPGDPRWQRDVLAIGDLADSVAGAYERIMAEATSLRDGRVAHEIRLDDLVGRTVRRMSAIHGPDRVTEVIESNVRDIRLPDFLGRPLGNVLDNALRASPDAPVRLHAAASREALELIVEDEGHGIPEELRATALEAGISSRLGAGGSGVGLTIAAEILAMLGGSIRLEARSPGPGTRAILKLPLVGGDRECAGEAACAPRP